MYSEVISDLNKTKEMWLKGEETRNLNDTRKWHGEQELIEPEEKTKKENNYKDMYFELKKDMMSF